MNDSIWSGASEPTVLGDERDSDRQALSERLETAEDVNEAYDAWVADDSSREMRSRKISLGTVVTLFERGASVATGRGAGITNALADALENLL